MTVWFVADTHFGHANIIRYCSRPFGSVDEMDKAIIERWNAVVKPGDEVIHVGDFASVKDPARYFDRLAGRKHLVPGNHDVTSKATLKLPWVSQREIMVVHVDCQAVVACHYPMRTWYGAAHGSLHVYGHVHGALRDTNKSVDVGVDVWGFAPVTLAAIKERMSRQSPSPDYPEG